MTTTTTPNSASLAQGALGSLNNLGSSSGTTLTQGSAAPNITTAQTTGSSLDPYYAQLEQNAAQMGTTGAQGAQFAGPTANQLSAFNNVNNLVGTQTYQPYLNSASQALNAAAGSSAAGAAQGNLNAAISTNPLSSASGYLGQATSNNPATLASPYLTQGATPQNIQAFTPYAQQASATSGLNVANPYLQAGTQSASGLINQYMSPYINDVVSQIGQLGQNQIAQNLAPSTTAGIVGAGQFGSTRGAQALGQTIANANTNILGQQSTALQAGYGQALTAAQQQLANELTAGQTAGALQQQQNTVLANLGQTAGTLTNEQAQNALTAGQTLGQLQQGQNQSLLTAGQLAGNLQQAQNQNLLTAAQTAGQLTASDMANQVAQAQAQANLGTTNQALGYNDLNALATLGAQQQTINQNQQLFPLQTAQSYANLLGSLTKPTSTTALTNAPASVYGPSGLAQLGALASTTGGVLNLVNQANNLANG